MTVETQVSNLKENCSPSKWKNGSLRVTSPFQARIPHYSFIIILFNDDGLLVGYYGRLGEFFGYRWRYLQLSEGIVWRAAILHGRQIVGGGIVDMHVKDTFLKIRKLLLRKEFVDAEMLYKMGRELNRDAVFQNKTLQMSKPKLV